MFKRMSLNRVLIGAIAVCVLFVGGSFLYMQDAKKEAERAKAEIQAAEQARAERLRQQQHTGSRPMDVGEAAPGLGAEAASSVSTDTAEHSPSETDAEVLEGTELSETDTAAADEPAEGVEVSPYGFGPYPEVPAGMPAGMPRDLFPAPSANHELMRRVLIKLISQGINVRGTTMEDGLIYPVIKGTAYVQWDSYWGPTGRVTYISRFKGHPDDGARMNAIRLETGRALTAADVPPDIKLLSFEDGAIDPYQFLDLP